MDDTSNSFMMTSIALGVEVEWFDNIYEFNFITSGMLCIPSYKSVWLAYIHQQHQHMARINLLSPRRCIANQMEMDIVTEIRIFLGMQSNWHLIVAHMAYSGHISPAQQFRSLRGSPSLVPHQVHQISSQSTS